jgi:hypothetical protein
LIRGPRTDRFTLLFVKIKIKNAEDVISLQKAIFFLLDLALFLEVRRRAVSIQMKKIGREVKVVR